MDGAQWKVAVSCHARMQQLAVDKTGVGRSWRTRQDTREDEQHFTGAIFSRGALTKIKFSRHPPIHSVCLCVSLVSCIRVTGIVTQIIRLLSTTCIGWRVMWVKWRRRTNMHTLTRTKWGTGCMVITIISNNIYRGRSLLGFEAWW